MTLGSWLLIFVDFAANFILPFLMGLALLFFLWNVTRYFIFQGTRPDAREKAKQYTLWGVIAHFVIIFVWGIVNFFIGTFGVGGVIDPITPDYMGERQAP